MTTFAPAKIGLKVGFERILVPTDFSDVSQRALEYAKGIAQRNDATILLTHAIEPFNPVVPPEVIWFDQFTVQHPEEEQLETEVAELLSQGFQARTISLNGPLQQEILASAERENADLIVMGTHGRTGLSRFFLGSEAESLFRRAKCPILVVGPAARPVAAQPWEPRDILYAGNLDPDSAPLAAFAYRMAQEYDADFAILHVDDSQGRVSQESQLRRFDFALAPLLNGGPKPNYLWRVLMIGYGLGSTIADQAIERNADLIVMGAHTASPVQTHLPLGVAPQVIAKATCPVMILHRQ
jgi:nucleotide-binding universal stress UspA family protein